MTSRLERDLNEICPCLFIRILKDKREDGTREILVRHPGDLKDLDAKVKNRRDLPGGSHDRVKNKDLKRQADDFCDCYKKHRAGCNLIWELATGNRDVVIWETDLGVGNRHRPPGDDKSKPSNIGYNRNPNRKSGKSVPPKSFQAKAERQRPTSIGLAHELSHAYLHMKGKPGSKNRNSDDYSEFQATRAENQIRQEMHDEAMAGPKRKTKKLSDKALEDYGNYKFPWPWLGRNDRNRVGRRTWPRGEYTDEYGTQTLPEFRDKGGKPKAPAEPRQVIATDDLFRCDDKKVGFIPSPPLLPLDPEKREYAVRFAYTDPELCVATTYYAGETVYTEETAPSYQFGVPISTAVPVPLYGTPDGGIPACPASTPPLTSTPAPSDTSQPQDTPDPTPTPEGQDTPTTTEVPVTPQPEDDDSDEDTDLGLVKAEETVVMLVLTGEETGNAVTGATVKLLDEEPELPPADGVSDPRLASSDNYTADVPGGAVNESGEVAIALTAEGGNTDGPELIEVAEDAPPAIGAGKKIVRQEVKIAHNPVEQLVVTQSGRPRNGANNRFCLRL